MPAPDHGPKGEAVTDLHRAVEADSPGRSPGTHHLVCVAELGHPVSMVEGLQRRQQGEAAVHEEEPSGRSGDPRPGSELCQAKRPPHTALPLNPRRSSPVAWGQMRSSLIWADHPHTHTPRMSTEPHVESSGLCSKCSRGVLRKTFPGLPGHPPAADSSCLSPHTHLPIPAPWLPQAPGPQHLCLNSLLPAFLYHSAD